MCSPFQPPPTRRAAAGSVAEPECLVQREGFRIAREGYDAARRKMCRMFILQLWFKIHPVYCCSWWHCVCAQLTGVSARAPALRLSETPTRLTSLWLAVHSLWLAAVEKRRFTLKGIVPLKIKILSSFAHPQVAPNLYDVRSFVECKRSLEECLHA